MKGLVKELVPARHRRRLARARLRVRRLTAPFRMLPDFLVLGTMRGGTSSLYKLLGLHPDAVPSIRKETEYFSRCHDQGLLWYRAHFPLSLRAGAHRRLRGHALRTFEATPGYLFNPQAPVRLGSLLPSARFVVLLRDPVERAYSHHRHQLKLGLEDLDFEQAIAREEERLAGERKRMEQDPEYHSRALHLYSYMDLGHYAEHLDSWLRHFPRDRFFIGRSEDLFEDPPALYDQIVRFLDLRPWRPRAFRNYSYRDGEAVRRARTRDMPAAARSFLIDHFAPHNRRLYDLLGRDMEWS